MKKWVSMLVAVATVAIGGVVYTVMAPKEGVRMADLVDGGIRADCVKRRANCSFVVNGNYVHKLVEVGLCGPDQVVVVPSKLAAAIQNFDAQCQRTGGCVGCDGGPFNADIDVSDEADVTPSCRCRGNGTCNVVATGQPALKDTTYAAADVAGAGCVPKACVEVAGVLSMPVECR